MICLDILKAIGALKLEHDLPPDTRRIWIETFLGYLSTDPNLIMANEKPDDREVMLRTENLPEYLVSTEAKKILQNIG